MKIPANHDRNKNYNSSFEQITPGGHKCVIQQAIEGFSQTKRPMLTISFDMSPEDTQPGYYMNRYMTDQSKDRKWRGNMYIVLDGEYAEQNLNKFVSALDHSNPNFTPVPGADLDPSQLKGMRIGIIFREEEYEPQTATMSDLMNGIYPVAVRPAFWCGYDTALEEKAPKKKALKKKVAAAPAGGSFTPTQGSDYGFVNVADGLEDEGLPFN